ncbi:MAG: hypothetical protein ABR542_00980 [Desulfonatronovibrio sp.]
METLKEEALHVLSHMPESSDIDDIMYNLYVLDKVRKGRQAFENGDSLSVNDLRKEIKLWSDGQVQQKKT